jgi:hypothetical protein
LEKSQDILHINIQSKTFIQNFVLLQYPCTQKYKYISAMPIKDELVPLWIDPSPKKKKTEQVA